MAKPHVSLARRQLLAMIALAAGSGPLRARGLHPLRALAFDAFVLFSPEAVVKRAREIAGDEGEALVRAASTKLFGYTWYYTSAGRYAEFDELAAGAFSSAAENLGLNLSRAETDRLVEGYAHLELWKDVPAALGILRRHGIRLAMLSNLSERVLRANLRANGIDQYFEFVLSTDTARQYKPGQAAYGLAVRAFNARREEIGFAASAGWDASGATWFGFPTVWVNRTGAPPEEALARPALVSTGTDGVLQLASLDRS